VLRRFIHHKAAREPRQPPGQLCEASRPWLSLKRRNESLGASETAKRRNIADGQDIRRHRTVARHSFTVIAFIRNNAVRAARQGKKADDQSALTDNGVRHSPPSAMSVSPRPRIGRLRRRISSPPKTARVCPQAIFVSESATRSGGRGFLQRWPSPRGRARCQ